MQLLNKKSIIQPIYHRKEGLWIILIRKYQSTKRIQAVISLRLKREEIKAQASI